MGQLAASTCQGCLCEVAVGPSESEGVPAEFGGVVLASSRNP